MEIFPTFGADKLRFPIPATVWALGFDVFRLVYAPVALLVVAGGGSRLGRNLGLGFLPRLVGSARIRGTRSVGICWVTAWVHTRHICPCLGLTILGVPCS